MQVQTLEDTPHYTIRVDQDKDIFHFKWKSGFVFKDEFKDIILNLANLVTTSKPAFLLVDARDMSYTVTEEVQEWHDKTIVPAYVEAQIKGIAFINAKSIFTEITFKKSFEREAAKKELQTMFFAEEEEAIAWFDELRASL